MLASIYKTFTNRDFCVFMAQWLSAMFLPAIIFTILRLKYERRYLSNILEAMLSFPITAIVLKIFQACASERNARINWNIALVVAVLVSFGLTIFVQLLDGYYTAKEAEAIKSSSSLLGIKRKADK